MKKNATQQSEKSEETNIIKKEEFEQFLILIKEENVGTWSMIAQALGVNVDTITAWKNHPRARAAIAEGIRHAVQQMETYGKRDWRMWREKAKMLGVSEVIRNEHGGEGGGPVKLQVEIVGQDRKRYDQDDDSTTD